MDQKTQQPLRRLILFTGGALADLAKIDNPAAALWGESQTERYLGFLHETLSMLAPEPRLAAVIAERTGYLIFTARYRRRRNAHGHWIIFREIANGIEVYRLLPTATDWPDYLPEGSA